VKSALEELESDGYVESKTIERADGRHTYYRIRKE
jgi:DNA-binding PadR family transcriptional regulator